MTTPTTAAGRALAKERDACLGVQCSHASDDAIIAIEAEARAAALEPVFDALTSEDEIAHGEAMVEREGDLEPLGVCAYCDGEWPCRTQQGIDRLIAAIDARPARPATVHATAQDAAPDHKPTAEAKTERDWAFRQHCVTDREPWPCRERLLADIATIRAEADRRRRPTPATSVNRDYTPRTTR